MEKKSTQPVIQPLAYRVADAERVSGLSRTTLDEKIAIGELKSKRVGGRRLIDAASLKALVVVD